MPKKTRTTNAAPVVGAVDIGHGLAMDPTARPIDLLNGLLATGMDLVDGLDTLAKTDPSMAQEAFLAWGRELEPDRSAVRYFGWKEGRIYPDGLDFENRAWLTALPEGLLVNGSLYMKGCAAFKSLPQRLRIEGLMDLRNCPSYDGELPEGVSFDVALSDHGALDE